MLAIFAPTREFASGPTASWSIAINASQQSTRVHRQMRWPPARVAYSYQVLKRPKLLGAENILRRLGQTSVHQVLGELGKA